jgi:uncharacterized protein
MTKKKTIRLAKGLELPLEVTTQKIALMGGNGSGKSYLGSKLEEEILRADGWTIILDPVGIHWGLRLSSDGITPSGLEIPVFGGLHGDVILTPESGALIADLLVDRRLSAVLDVSQFTDPELNRFSTDFGNRFWSRMKAKRQAVLLVFEEAQEFIPQNPQKGEEKKLHIYTRIAKLGRNYGIGVMLISQRPQDINKKVFNLTQLMFAFQMTGTHERKALEDWISYVGLDYKFSDILPMLEVGEPFVASPRWLKVAEKFKIEEKKTFDSSATPEFDEEAETVRLDPIDISSLESRMKSLIQEAKDNDPAELKKEILRLKKEIERRPVQIKPEVQVERVEVPILTDAQLKELDRSLGSVRGLYNDFKGIREELVALLDGKIDSLDKTANVIFEAIALSKKAPRVDLPRKAVKPVIARPARPEKAPERGGESELYISKPIQRILNSIAELESINLYNPSRSAIAFLSGQGTAPESFKKNLGSASVRGLIVYPDSKTVSLTDYGRSLAKSQERPVNTEALQESILSKLPPTQAKILSFLIEAYPDPLDRGELANMSGQHSAPEAYKKNLSSLRSFGLIDYPSSSQVVALPVLFLEEA